MKIIAGEVDWARQYASMVNLPSTKRTRRRAATRSILHGLHVAPVQIAINFTHPDTIWRQVVRDVRFRKALNMAINHQQVVDTVYQGFGTVPDWFGIKYDKAGAAKLLDEVMPQKDSEGWRLGPDGKRFVFPVEVSKGYTPEHGEMVRVADVLLAGDRPQGRPQSRWRCRSLCHAQHQQRRLHVHGLGADPVLAQMMSGSSGDWRPDVAQLWLNWYQHRRERCQARSRRPGPSGLGDR